jgi:HTH-type transcriptional regulator/antitoxin HigA
MDIRPIRTEADYDWALAEIAPYFEHEPEPGTPQADRFDVLASLIGYYEDRVWPIEAPDPVDALKFRMEQAGLSQGDLATLIGSKPRASEILNRHRRITMEQAYLLHREWKIPAEVLIAPSKLVA